ncbi:hypothetical protein FRC10_012265 [Ceratobasidium sp. 414]|nr:hypothetical protein FRC10_012265 [Ceratobasidium sp. 414]
MTDKFILTCYEPFRTGFLAYRVISVLVKLPFWALYYSIPRNRPRASWSWRKAIMLNLAKCLNELSTRTGRFWNRDPTKEVPQKECKGARFTWIEPVPRNLITGQLEQFATATGAESVRIPAYGFGEWTGTGTGEPLRPAGENEKIVMHFHGGSYVVSPKPQVGFSGIHKVYILQHGTAHPEDGTSGVSRSLLEWGQTTLSRTLSIDYRLCSAAPYVIGPPITFASPLLDALAGYVHLVQKLGFKPQNIIIAGDSAGGHLALALARYLRDNPDLGLGMPGGLLLFSPWADPMGVHHAFGSGNKPANAGECDFLDFWSKSDYSVGVYSKRALFDNIGVPPEAACQNPYITPTSPSIKTSELDGLFTGFPPTYIVSGDAESLIDEIRILERRMSNSMPEGTVVYDEVADAIHDFVVFPGWEPERSNTFQKVVAWIQQL